MFRFLFVLVVMVFYGLLYTDQRIEFRENTREINKLIQQIEVMNARKQELTILIEQERIRLSKQSESIHSQSKPSFLLVKDGACRVFIYSIWEFQKQVVDIFHF